MAGLQSSFDEIFYCKFPLESFYGCNFNGIVHVRRIYCCGLTQGQVQRCYKRVKEKEDFICFVGSIKTELTEASKCVSRCRRRSLMNEYFRTKLQNRPQSVPPVIIRHHLLFKQRLSEIYLKGFWPFCHRINLICLTVLTWARLLFALRKRPSAEIFIRLRKQPKYVWAPKQCFSSSKNGLWSGRTVWNWIKQFTCWQPLISHEANFYDLIKVSAYGN